MSEALFTNRFTITEKVEDESFSYNFDVVFTNVPSVNYHPPVGPPKSGAIYGPFDAAMVLDDSARLDSLGRTFNVEASYKYGKLNFEVQKSDASATLHLSCDSDNLASLRKNYLDFKLGETDLLAEGSALESADGLTLVFSDDQENAGKASFELDVRANPQFGNVKDIADFSYYKLGNDVFLTAAIVNAYESSNDENVSGDNQNTSGLNVNWRCKTQTVTDENGNPIDRFNKSINIFDVLPFVNLYSNNGELDDGKTYAEQYGIAEITN